MIPGNVPVLRPALPQFPGDGLTNAAELNQSSRRRPPDGSSETPGRASGLVSPPAFEKFVRAATVNGLPVLNAWIPRSCQPPSSALPAPVRVRPNGRSYV